MLPEATTTDINPDEECDHQGLVKTSLEHFPSFNRKKPSLNPEALVGSHVLCPFWTAALSSCFIPSIPLSVNLH